MAEFALMLGGFLFLGFGLLALPLPDQAKGNEYSETMRAIGRVMWPVGLALALAGGLGLLVRLF